MRGLICRKIFPILPLALAKSNAIQYDQTIDFPNDRLDTEMDCTKKNLVASMTLLKRLQMLVNVNNTLSSILPSHDYKEIYQLLVF